MLRQGGSLQSRGFMGLGHLAGAKRPSQKLLCWVVLAYHEDD